MKIRRVIRWIVGVFAGLFVFIVVTLISLFSFPNMAPGFPTIGKVLAFSVPLLLGVLTGVRSCRSIVRHRGILSFFWDSEIRRGYPPGHCQRCGYDLTGNLSGVCPECGTTLSEAGPSGQPTRDMVIGGLAFVVLGSLVSVFVMGIPRNNSVAAYIAAWIVGACYATVVETVVWSGALRRRKRLTGVRIACAVAVGGLASSHFLLTKDVAFNRAFGTDVPSSIQDIMVEGSYATATPPGDLMIFLQFKVDQTGLQRILLNRGFTHDREAEQRWRDGELWAEPPPFTQTRARIWDSLFGWCKVFSGEAWRNIALPARVEIYEWGLPAMDHTRLLWDVDTGRAYVVYTGW